MPSGLLTLLAILIVSEVLLITIAATIFFIFKKKKSAVKQTESVIQPKPKPAASVAPRPGSNSSYWDQEITRTKNILLSRHEDALIDLANIDFIALNLRLQMLQLEQKNSLTESDKRKIEVIEYDITNILKRMNIIHAIEMSKRRPEDGYDDEGAKRLIEQQNQTIAFLKKYTRDILDKILKQNADFLGSQQGPDDVAKLSVAHDEFMVNTQSLMEKIDKLEYQNNELTMCVSVLEEENQFLRDQIASLLKLQQ